MIPTSTYIFEGKVSRPGAIYRKGYEALATLAQQNEETLVFSETAGEEYIENAISQEINMDWILFYVVKASYPEKSWQELQPKLEQLCLSPVSSKPILAFINTPPSLGMLLSRVNCDFAVPLFGQCQKVVLSEGVVTPEEYKVLNKIETALNLILEPQ